MVAPAAETEDAAPERLPAVGQRRMLEWADPDAVVTASLRPAFRVLYLQAPAFVAMWQSALDDLAEAPVRRLAANRTVAAR